MLRCPRTACHHSSSINDIRTIVTGGIGILRDSSRRGEAVEASAGADLEVGSSLAEVVVTTGELVPTGTEMDGELVPAGTPIDRELVPSPPLR